YLFMCVLFCPVFLYHLFCSVIISLADGHPLLPSFPTRRSSDLTPPQYSPGTGISILSSAKFICTARTSNVLPRSISSHSPGSDRSEEHTSELQSRFDLVCRLLLEKKK